MEPRETTSQDHPLPSARVSEAGAPSAAPDVAEPIGVQSRALAPAAGVRPVGAEVADRVPLLGARSDDRRLHGLRSIHLGYRLLCEGDVRGAPLMEEGAGALVAELKAKPRPHAEVAVIGAEMACRDGHGAKNRWREGMAAISVGYTLMSMTSAAPLAFGTALMERGAVALIVDLMAGPGATTQTATPGDAEGHYWDDEKYRGRRDLHAIDIGYALFCMGSDWGILLMEVGAEALIAELRNGRGENPETASSGDAEGMQAGGTMADGAAGEVDPLEVLSSIVRRAASEPRSDNTVPSVPRAPDPTPVSPQVPAPTPAEEAPCTNERVRVPGVAAPNDGAPPLLAVEVPHPEGQSLPAVEAPRGEGQPLTADEAPRGHRPPALGVEAPFAPAPTAVDEAPSIDVCAAVPAVEDRGANDRSALAAEVRGTEGLHLPAVEAPRGEGKPLAAAQAPRASGPPVPAVEAPCVPAPTEVDEAPSIDVCVAAPAVEGPGAESPPALAAEVRGTEGSHLVAIQAPRADVPSVLAVETLRADGPSMPAGEAPRVEECAPVPAVEAPRVDQGHGIVFIPPSARTRRAHFLRARHLSHRPTRVHVVERLASMHDPGTPLNEFVEAVVARLKAEGLILSRPASASNEATAPATPRGTRSRAAVQHPSPALAPKGTAPPANLGEAPTPPIASSGWYDQDSVPIARRTYLELCRKGKIACEKIGKRVLVKCEVFDAWIASQRKSAGPAATPPPPTPPAPTNEELLRGAGVLVLPNQRRAARSSADPPAVAAPRAGRHSK